MWFKTKHSENSCVVRIDLADEACSTCVAFQGKAKKKAAYSDDECDDDSDFETKVHALTAPCWGA